MNVAKPKPLQILGVLLVSMGSLTLEIAFTRVFSVIMWYHFAFLAISLALMGSAGAGVALFLLPRLTVPETAPRWIERGALGLALSIPICLVLFLRVPFDTTAGLSALQVLWLALIYLVLAIPFFFSGLIISLALTIWSQQVGHVYWADLTGASLGCLVAIVALEALGGAGAVLALGVLAALAGAFFTLGAADTSRRLIVAGGVAILMMGLLVGNARWGWIGITSYKGGGEEPPRVYEKWNAHSRVTVYETANYPFFWSIDMELWERTIEEGGTFPHALLLIDSVAGTPIQKFNGDLNQVRFLRRDLTSLVYHLIEEPLTLVIGPGGGRDVLAALASGAPHVTAVEVNPAVVEAVRGPFAEFSGRLYERPEVTIAIADARGYIHRSTERYDVIQASLIDTWAAGGSGAFALSENSLYTQEAFETYYHHLTDRGLLTVSRWYQTHRPAETMRLVSTAMAGWRRAGVGDPRQHVAVVARDYSGAATEGLATALFKRAPFTPEEVAELQVRAEKLGAVVIYAPGLPAREEVGEFILHGDHDAFVADYPLDISAATDDRPFFFNLVRLGDLLNPELNLSMIYQVSVEAIVILGAVIGISLVIGVLLISVPLLVMRRRGSSVALPSGRLLAYFALLGMAFMIVEIPTIQKLTVYLGRPVYSLAIVLFSLLLSSSLGSLWSSRWAGSPNSGDRLRRLFIALVAVILLHAATSFFPLPQTQGLPFGARLLITVVLLIPPGFLMGMPFPFGIRWVGRKYETGIPWLWAINGVASVLGSALATALAIQFGFRVTLLFSAGLYGLAGLLMGVEVRSMEDAPGRSELSELRMPSEA
jgi:hypothetical protein